MAVQPEHEPLVHLTPDGHAFPQEPQWVGSLVRLAQVIVPLTGHKLVALTHVQMPPSVPGWHVTDDGQT
jgi:hypothetical protein